MYSEYKDDIDARIKEIYDNNERITPTNPIYYERLNWKLTEYLNEELQEKNYAIRKYTLFPTMLSDG